MTRDEMRRRVDLRPGNGEPINLGRGDHKLSPLEQQVRSNAARPANESNQVEELRRRRRVAKAQMSSIAQRLRAEALAPNPDAA